MGMRKIKLKLRAIPPAIEERDGSYYITQSSVSFAAVISVAERLDLREWKNPRFHLYFAN